MRAAVWILVLSAAFLAVVGAEARNAARATDASTTPHVPTITGQQALARVQAFRPKAISPPHALDEYLPIIDRDRSVEWSQRPSADGGFVVEARVDYTTGRTHLWRFWVAPDGSELRAANRDAAEECPELARWMGDWSD